MPGGKADEMRKLRRRRRRSRDEMRTLCRRRRESRHLLGGKGTEGV